MRPQRKTFLDAWFHLDADASKLRWTPLTPCDTTQETQSKYDNT